MVVNIPNRIFEDARNDDFIGQALKLLFCLFESGKHEWYIKDYDHELLSNPVLASYREYIKKAVVHSVYKQNEPKYLVRIGTIEFIKMQSERLEQKEDVSLKKYLDGKRVKAVYGNIVHDFISIELIDTYLNRPLKILVENIESDGLFIKTCLRYFRNSNWSEPWYECVHGGGNDIAKVANSIQGKERVICIIDGDKSSPTKINRSKQRLYEELKDICEEYGYVLYRLKKREIENYIPDEALKRFLESKGKDFNDYYFYFCLDDNLKDYFDLKKGLSEDELNCDIWKNLLRDIDNETAAALDNCLQKGFGEKIYKAFEFVENSDELRKRDYDGELPELVKLIETLV